MIDVMTRQPQIEAPIIDHVPGSHDMTAFEQPFDAFGLHRQEDRFVGVRQAAGNLVADLAVDYLTRPKVFEAPEFKIKIDDDVRNEWAVADMKSKVVIDNPQFIFAALETQRRQQIDMLESMLKLNSDDDAEATV